MPKQFITLTDVKIYNDYTYSKLVAPTAAEKAPIYSNGETWLNTVTGYSYELTNATVGNWVQIETNKDARITINSENTFNTVLRYLSNYFFSPRFGDYYEKYGSFYSEFDRREQFIITENECVYSEFTFSSGAKTATAGTDIFGSLTDSFKTGDVVYILGMRNKGYYTISNVSSTVLTFTENIISEIVSCFIFLSDVPKGLIAIIARMLWYDVYMRDNFNGLQSETIGTYSWTKAKTGKLNYPEDIISGLDSYDSLAIGGLSVFVD